MKFSEVKQMFKEEYPRVFKEPAVDLKTAVKIFDKLTNKEFGLSKIKWNKKIKLSSLGVFGKLLKEAHIKLWDKGRTQDDKYSYYNFYMRWKYKNNDWGSARIGIIYIDNKDHSQIFIRLEDGRTIDKRK